MPALRAGYRARMRTHGPNDPDSVDPTHQSGRPFIVTGAVLLLLLVLAVLVVIGVTTVA